ncbi:MAG: YceI family protein [bacterium]|nr:YceI family protein [bacterium]
MKKISFLLAFAMVAFAFSSIAQNTVTVDNAKSTIKWEGAKVGGSHNGTINLKSGSLSFENNSLVGGSFEIDMNTITNTDLEGEYKGKLEGHLKSDDFFGVATYPTAKLDITKVTPQGPGKYKVEANITIKGKTEAIKFNTTVSEDSGSLIASADITVDRSDFDVKYGSGSFFDNLGDKVIYDDFDLNVTLVAGSVTGDE